MQSLRRIALREPCFRLNSFLPTRANNRALLPIQISTSPSLRFTTLSICALRSSPTFARFLSTEGQKPAESKMIETDEEKQFKREFATIISSGITEKALEACQGFLQKHPSSSIVRNTMITIMLRLGKHQGAHVECDKLLETSPNDFHANNFKGHAFLQEGKLNEAIPYLQKAIDAPVHDHTFDERQRAMVYQNLAQVYGQLGMEEQYQHTIKSAWERNKENIDLTLAYAMTLCSKGETDQAAILINPIISQSHDYTTTQIFQLATILGCLKEISNAKALLEGGLSIMQNNSGLYFLLAKCYWAEDDHQKALEMVKKACDLQPNIPIYWLALAHCYHTMGDQHQALHAAKKNLQLVVYSNKDETLQHARVHLLLSLIHGAMGDNDNKTMNYNKAVDIIMKKNSPSFTMSNDERGVVFNDRSPWFKFEM